MPLREGILRNMKEGRRTGEKYRQYVGIVTVNNWGYTRITGENCWIYLTKT